MKVYISVDIEGVAGITHWDEAEIGKPGYEAFREQMTAEATAAGARIRLAMRVRAASGLLN